MAVGYEMSIQDYLRVIFKRKWIILICAFTIFVTAIVYTSKLPPVYVAYGRVELNYQSTLATLLADALLYKGNELATAIQFATSLPVMERAARDLGIVGPDATKAELHSAASSLKNGVSASGDGQTNFISISYSHSDPKQCAAVVDAVATAFSKEYRARNTRDADQIKLFLEEQMKIAEERLLASENELLVMKQQRSYVELEPGVRVGLERAANLEAEYEKVRVEAAQVGRQLETVRREVQAGRPEDRTADLVQRHPGIQAIRKELFEAEVDLASRLKNLTIRHPEVREAEDRVRQLRVRLELTISEFFDERRANLETQYASLKARELALERAIPQLKMMTDEIPRQQLEQARIMRAVAMQEKLYNFFRDKLEEKKYEDLVNRDNVINVVERAAIPAYPIYPNKKTNAMVGLAIGIMLGFALAFVVEAMDTSIGTIEDVERTTGLSVLGVIPSIAVDEEEAAVGEKSIVTFDPERVRTRDVKGRLMELDTAVRKEEEGSTLFKPQLITFHDPKSPISEAYRTLRTNVQFKGLLGSAKTLTVTSSGPQEGKTTTLCNLAVAMAQAGQKVLAVGCNLRRPALHKILGIRKKPGVTDILIGARSWQEVVQPTGIENLDAFCSGPIPPNPSELLGSPEMTELIRQLREAYDIVIFDCPPVLPVTDAAVLSSKVDSVLMVYYVGRAAREALLRAKVQLENVGARILGVVLNHIPAEGRLGYSYYYYHYHYYGESSRDEKNARVLKRRKN
jgi:tyrosine-protein kinase Etk/Wzc